MCVDNNKDTRKPTSLFTLSTTGWELQLIGPEALPSREGVAKREGEREGEILLLYQTSGITKWLLGQSSTRKLTEDDCENSYGPCKIFRMLADLLWSSSTAFSCLSMLER